MANSVLDYQMIIELHALMLNYVMSLYILTVLYLGAHVHAYKLVCFVFLVLNNVFKCIPFVLAPGYLGSILDCLTSLYPAQLATGGFKICAKIKSWCCLFDSEVHECSS